MFATPFASVGTGLGNETNARLAKVCEDRQRESSPRDSAVEDPLHFRSSPNFLEETTGATRELREVVLRYASRVVGETNAFTADQAADLKIDLRSWCSIIRPDGHIPVQRFQDASWLAVYCVQAGERIGGDASGARDSGILRIHETRLSSVFRDASNWNARTPYRYGHYNWTPEPGRMALFPAHVQHEVSLVRSQTALILVFALLRFLNARSQDSRYR